MVDISNLLRNSSKIDPFPWAYLCTLPSERDLAKTTL